MVRANDIVEPRVDRPVEQDAGGLVGALCRDLLAVGLASRDAPPLAQTCAVRAGRVGAGRAELDLVRQTAPEPRAGERAQAGGLALASADVEFL